MPSLVSILPQLAFLDAVVQDNTLVREFYDALYPKQLYRADALPEKWEANMGERQVFTRSSLLAPITAPLLAGVDPNPVSPSYEQWDVTAQQYGNTLDTHMPSSRTALASLFARNAKTLGLNAGQSLNRLARDKLFSAYLGGSALATAAGVTVAALPVSSINGFSYTISNGAMVPVSPTYPLTATLSGVGTVTIIGAAPTDATQPLGPGVLTLSATASWSANAVVTASNAPVIVRSGGGTSIDDLVSSDILTVADIRNAVALMRRNNVPTHEDGMYHVHLDPVGCSQIFNDNEFQRLNQSLPDGVRYREFAVGMLAGCVFYENAESPSVTTVGATATQRTNALVSPALGAEVRNTAGVNVIRTLITGGGCLMEKWVDENNEYVSEAGYTGKVGSFRVVNNSLIVPVERCRYIIRAPQDRLQQIVTQSWSATLDFGVPTDLLGGQNGARFKRATIIESGTSY